MALTPGTTLGPYRILDHIGSGGMGEVYRVQDSRLGRELALKVLPQDRTVDLERRQRFMQEARAASALNHPNIITIYDIGTEGGVDYIAMEYVDGKTLDQIIPPRGFRFEQALKLAIPIADGLAKAHSAGIIHRDLKPGNVMVTEDGRVKLLDFGLAKLTEVTEASDQEGTHTVISGSPRTTEGMILGTASYMSPEQAEGKKVDSRSDIFSFGAVLYEMVTGQRAFESGSTISTLSAILKEEPEQISAVKSGIPPEFQRVVSRCLKKDPDRRWHNMKDVKVALEELKEESDSGILAVPPPAPAPRRPNWLWPAIGGGAVLVAVLAVFAWKAIGSRGAETPPGAPAPAAEQPAPATSEKPPAAVPAAPSETPLTNDQVVEMVKAGVSDRLIMDHIHRSPTNFDLSIKEIIRLTKERVPETVIAMMRNPKATPAAVIAQLSRASQPPEPKKAAAPPVAAAPPPQPAPPLAEPAPPPAPEKVKLAEGAKVVLALAEQVDLTALREADRVAFITAEDVKVGDVVVIAKGAAAGGTVVHSKRQRLFSKSRRVEIRLETVEAIDRQRVKIVPAPGPTTAEGDRGLVLSLAAGGSDAANPATKSGIIPQGTEFTVLVAGDREITVAPAEKH